MNFSPLFLKFQILVFSQSDCSNNPNDFLQLRGRGKFAIFVNLKTVDNSIQKFFINWFDKVSLENVKSFKI